MSSAAPSAEPNPGPAPRPAADPDLAPGGPFTEALVGLGDWTVFSARALAYRQQYAQTMITNAY